MAMLWQMDKSWHTNFISINQIYPRWQSPKDAGPGIAIASSPWECQGPQPQFDLSESPVKAMFTLSITSPIGSYMMLAKIRFTRISMFQFHLPLLIWVHHGHEGGLYLSLARIPYQRTQPYQQPERNSTMTGWTYYRRSSLWSLLSHLSAMDKFCTWSHCNELDLSSAIEHMCLCPRLNNSHDKSCWPMPTMS